MYTHRISKYISSLKKPLQQCRTKNLMACIVAKLLYGLDSAWLSSAMQRKLDGFQAKCLRRILKISPAFISRVSNKYIRNQFKAHPLSVTLLERQLMLFGHVARAPQNSILYRMLFDDNQFNLRELPLKRGRPKDTWARKLKQASIQCCGSVQQFASMVKDPIAWKATVRHFCRQCFTQHDD